MEDSSKVKTRVIRRGVTTDDNIDAIVSGTDKVRADRAVLAKFESDKTLRSPIERVVGSTICHLNFLVKELMEPFKSYPQHWTVGMFYPYAKGGPVYIDSPNSNSMDMKICEQKREILKTAGKRYAIVSQNKEGLDMDMQGIAEQLG